MKKINLIFFQVKYTFKKNKKNISYHNLKDSQI
jgi:hypothetical protein